jgi:CRP-like cAMP-binding protein
VSDQSNFYTGNLLLRAISSDDLALLKPHLVRVELEREQTLVAANEPIKHVYFPEGGIASIVSDMEETGPTEVGLFGCEGMSGVSAILGSDVSPNKTFMQVDGATALCIELSQLRAAIAQSPTILAVFLKYVQTLLVQVTHSAVTNAHHRMEARLARWLLMCHDRVEGDDIPLTHRFMSMMITAQRSGVTVTLHILEGGGAIRSTRGMVTIRSRERLEEIAGEAYGAPEAEYSRLIAPFGRSSTPLDGQRELASITRD